MLIHRVSAAAFALLAGAAAVQAQSAYVRVNQVGYEAYRPSSRAYLMSAAPESGANFSVLDAQGQRRIYRAHWRAAGHLEQ